MAMEVAKAVWLPFYRPVGLLAISISSGRVKRKLAIGAIVWKYLYNARANRWIRHFNFRRGSWSSKGFLRTKGNQGWSKGVTKEQQGGSIRDQGGSWHQGDWGESWGPGAWGGPRGTRGIGAVRKHVRKIRSADFKAVRFWKPCAPSNKS